MTVNATRFAVYADFHLSIHPSASLDHEYVMLAVLVERVKLWNRSHQALSAMQPKSFVTCFGIFWSRPAAKLLACGLLGISCKYQRCIKSENQRILQVFWEFRFVSHIRTHTLVFHFFLYTQTLAMMSVATRLYSGRRSLDRITIDFDTSQLTVEYVGLLVRFLVVAAILVS